MNLEKTPLSRGSGVSPPVGTNPVIMMASSNQEQRGPRPYSREKPTALQNTGQAEAGKTVNQLV